MSGDFSGDLNRGRGSVTGYMTDDGMGSGKKSSDRI